MKAKYRLTGELWLKFKVRLFLLHLLALGILLAGPVYPQTGTYPLSGLVTDQSGKPVSGATVKIRGQAAGAVTDRQGRFSIRSSAATGLLTVSYVGYKSASASFGAPADRLLHLTLIQDMADLQEVQVVSTGYQQLPKERATGSFVLVDSALLHRKPGTNILERLDGVTSGLIFNKNLYMGNSSDISIRGRSTLFANTSPLVVLDNFPYDGDMANINPDDVASITVLKDAAAASIWGVRAGNGVIVITTKKGRPGDRVNVSLSAATTIADKINLHYQPQMSAAAYIELEQYLFGKGYFDNTINTVYSAITPAVALLQQQREGRISAAELENQLQVLKQADARDEIEKFVYRRAISQQYALSLDGGSKNNRYFLSAGYNKDLQAVVSNSAERFTLNARNTVFMLNDKLQLTAGLMLSTRTARSNTEAYTISNVPYERLADEQGNHLAVVPGGGLRKQYTDTAGKGQLLDWNYRPLDENDANQLNNLTDYKLNTDLSYGLMKGLNAVLSYQYEKGVSTNSLLHTAGSFYARNLINQFSQFDPETSAIIRPVPLGAISRKSNSSYFTHYGRFQLNYTGKFAEKHELTALGGAEVKNSRALNYASQLYGFNISDASAIPVDYVTDFPQYASGYTDRIPDIGSQGFTVDRFRSLFFNAAYTYSNKYVLSVSARRDESNIFGVKANQKGVPLWSAGLSWNISRENFYRQEWLPELKLRLTYGYNGNLDRSVSAYLTAWNRGATNTWNIPFSEIINPPNPALRWEKVRNLNFGLDFSSKNNLISGSLDYYVKKGIDLIGNSPLAPQTGVAQFRGNTAGTRTKGADLVLNKNAVTGRPFGWQSNLLFSYNKDKVTSYKVKQGNNLDIVSANYANPLEGYPYYSIFSFKSLGLNQEGRPQGVLQGKASQDYTAILHSTDPAELLYHGAASPLIFGSFRNTFSYNGIELSFNITYKLNYFFRNSQAFSGSIYNFEASDYEKRWQQPGDEQHTYIPGLIYPADYNQDSFFRYSSDLIEKADHIRLQDIRAGYTFPKLNHPLLKRLQVYALANNVGLLWKATRLSLDPDYAYSKYISPRSFSVGISANFN